jgi:ABC-type histidine transport system ATPase subunit
MPDNSGTSGRRCRAPIATVERAFNEAIDRLVAGKPKNPKLRRLAAEGRLNVNPSTVALEAGRSRTLIALESCRLPSVRNRILMLSRQDEVAAPRTAAEVIIRLREQVIDLKRQLSSALEAQAEHFLAREKAERDAAKWRDAMRREQNHREEDAKVVPIKPKGPKK